MKKVKPEDLGFQKLYDKIKNAPVSPKDKEAMEKAARRLWELGVKESLKYVQKLMDKFITEWKRR